MKKLYNNLLEYQNSILQGFDSKFKREVFHEIYWEDRFIGLIGERGVGKTTIMLQKLKETGGFYFSADDALLAGDEIGILLKFIHYLYFELGIKQLYIDEIHRYRNWTQEIKNIFDSMPDIKIVFSGSSSLDLYKGVLDLVRRVDFYNIYPMNYKEYLKLYHNIEIPTFSLEEILTNHLEIDVKYANLHKQTYFDEFLQKGQYPYIKKYLNGRYIKKFKDLMEKVIMEDLPIFVNLETISLEKIKRLLYFIANTTPSELSFTHLSNKVGISQQIVENVLTLLSKIGIISLVPKFGNLSERVRKEYKIFLGNTCLYNAYNSNTDVGILRECFFISQVKRIKNIEIFTPKEGDFILQIYDKSWQFEIGGKNKSSGKYSQDTFIIKDDIKISEDKKVIPLWLFGLLNNQITK